jgi:hypothetical protein
MQATDAHINVNKSHAIALGSWNKSTPMMDINYQDDIILLGFHMAKNIKQSTNKTCEMLTAKIRALAPEDYHRALNLEHRILYVSDYLLARVWYTTQIFSPPTDHARQINTAISWFIWKGAIFTVPLSTLQRPKECGDRALTHIMAKFMKLFLLRMEKQGRKERYFHCRMAHEMALTWKHTQPPTYNDGPQEI